MGFMICYIDMHMTSLFIIHIDSLTMYRWMASLDPMEAGGPHVITATAGNVSVTLNDVLFGDVWICSGQSNMQFTVPSVGCM